uniref:hypothetical protein n=1 Tax=unclassified Variovorax TaxID=663243 RepID=UPI000D37A50C
MQMQSEVLVHGIKESTGTFEGRAFSSTVFHCEVDMKENGAGRAIGHVTRPFKLGDHTEFEKWAHLGPTLNAGPIRALATFELEATREEGSKLALVGIRPVDLKQQPNKAPQAV